MMIIFITDIWNITVINEVTQIYCIFWFILLDAAALYRPIFKFIG